MNVFAGSQRKIKFHGMGEFNSDDHFIYYCGQESLRRNGVVIMVNKRVQNAVLGCNLKNDRMICSFPSQTRGRNAKVGSQETCGVTGNLALEYTMK